MRAEDSIKTYGARSAGTSFRNRLLKMSASRRAGETTRSVLNTTADVIIHQGPQIGRSLGVQQRKDQERARQIRDQDPLDTAAQICNAVGSVTEEPTDR